ncbi:DUF4097 family beta strand repeat-containing protein [Paenibacillus xylaniclasticus]|uniref:DUF4097 family beta strand repeat-containing protein n=1 Tax=Paenibacillus xylaniclasticus TaxID=588083 RepID=UPI000FD91EDA|nr:MULTISPECIES: DUF4097 family beta strand repeat-containing protein [Paenibacillus]GFN32838.1 hypothetical protein PCURB6_30980 [Paenibacillus curdlanolyticus]
MRKWIGIGLILVAVGVAGLFSPWSNWRNESIKTVEVNEQHRVPVKDVKRLFIEMDSENVRVVQGDGSDIVIRVEGKVSAKNSERKKIDIDVSNGTLHARKPDWGITVGYNVYSLKLIVEVPGAAYDAINIETDSGNIELHDLEFGKVKLDSDSGDILAQQIKAQSIKLETDSGDAVLEDTAGEIIAVSDSGDFYWKGPEFIWPIKVKSDSGDVAFDVGHKPEQATVKYKSDSGYGVIEWDGDEVDSGESIKEVYGSGAPMINVVTDSGDFIMKNE